MSAPVGQPSWEQINDRLVIRATDRDAPSVVVSRSVRGVIFKSPFLTDAGFKKIVSKFHCGITSIEISGLHISDRGLAKLKYEMLLRLRIFRAGGCPELGGVAIAAFLSKQLRELDLSGPNRIKPQQWKTIANKTPQLTYLDISENIFETQAILQAFQHCWTMLRTLKARNCKGLSFEEVEKWPAFANGLISKLDVRGSIEADAKTLIDALPNAMQAVLLGKVSVEALQKLQTKMPLSDVEISRSTVSYAFVKAAKQGGVSGFHLNYCRRFPKEGLTLFERWPLKRLSLAGSTLSDEQLLKLSFDQLEELDVSGCPWLKGEGWGRLKLPAMKRLLLNDLKCVTDELLKSIKFSKEICEISLRGTSVTWNGILHLVKGCRPARLVIPKGEQWIVEDGSSWKNTDFLTLLPYLTHEHTVVELSGFKRISEEAWTEFIERLAGVESLTLSKCANILPDHLWMIAEARSLKKLTLKKLRISLADAEERLQQGKYSLDLLDLPEVVDPDSEELGKAILAFQKNPKDQEAIDIFLKLKDQFPRACFYYGMSQGGEKGREYVEEAGLKKCDEAKIQLARWLCEDESEADHYGVGLEHLQDVVRRSRRSTMMNEARYELGRLQLLRDPANKEGLEMIGRASAAGHRKARKLEKELDLSKWEGLQIDSTCQKSSKNKQSFGGMRVSRGRGRKK